MKRKIIIGGLILIIGLGFLYMIKQNSKEKFLAKYGFNNLTTEEIILTLEDKLDEKQGFFASVNGKALTIGDNNKKLSLSLPKEKFYLSLAPYINNTHPCSIHNLVTCRGEFKNKLMEITVIDQHDNIIISGEYHTLQNGFVGLWLPKDITATITVTYDGLTASETITTSANSNTCLTTLQLK